ncbi:hypothetical protein [Arcanobacterium hippocoleae]|uniref:hypothetical protein n=1 Tax=Arcanobacterium hippocoleae TaxID=149017 RepID=UPI00333F4E69
MRCSNQYLFRQEADSRFLAATSTAPDGAGALSAIAQDNALQFHDVHEHSQIAKITAKSTVVIVNPENIGKSDIAALTSSGAKIILLVSNTGYFLPDWGIEAITVPVAADKTIKQTFVKTTAEDGTDWDSPLHSAHKKFVAKHQNGYTLTANCEFPPAAQAQAIGPVEDVFTDFISQTDACFTTHSSTGKLNAALITSPKYQNVQAFTAPVIFANTFLTLAGNSAFALNLLGQYPDVYWIENYHTPSDPSQDPAVLQSGALPAWINIFGIGVCACALWLVLYKSRRFGKLVPEPMPVVVPSGESDLGRAQLYARSRDWAHLARIFRNDFLTRHAKIYFSSQTETSVPSETQLLHDQEQILDALAMRTNTPRSELAQLLFTQEINTKANLARLQAELEKLTKELQ